MENFCSLDQVNQYYRSESKLERIKFLSGLKIKGKRLPFEVVRDLFSLSLSNLESIALLESCHITNKPEFELWIFDNLLKFSQDVAATALRTWAEQTDTQLWHRVIPLMKIPSLPQRLHYTVLDIGQNFAGRVVTDTALNISGWEDYSQAYHALLFDRAIQFGCQSERLTQLAKKILKQNSLHSYPEDKSLSPAVAWLLFSGQMKHLQTELSHDPKSTWKQIYESAILCQEVTQKRWEKVSKGIQKGDEIKSSKILESLPPVWNRNFVSGKDLIPRIDHFSATESIQFLSGMARSEIDVIESEVLKSTNPKISYHIRSMSAYYASGRQCNSKILIERQEMLTASGVFGSFKKIMTEDFETPISDESLTMKGSIESLRSNSLDFFNAVSHSPRSDAQGSLKGSSSDPSRSTPDKSNNTNFWSLLGSAWMTRDTGSLNTLAIESRKNKGIATLAYLKTLGRFKGSDEAVLKIMDHIRTSDEDELKQIVQTLGEIDTSRSLLELISVLTRPNVTTAIQQDATAILQKKNLDNLQKELRATIQDLSVPVDPASPILEIKETLSSLLNTKIDTPSGQNSFKSKQNDKALIDDKRLDLELSEMIPHYSFLSSEVRKALRTALFFNHSISGNEDTHAIDLSPLIDMQYKAMELLFRETFEESVSQALQKGDIPRKLDVIGYARPIPQKMDEFEQYIAMLPVVRDIPFFSKFKLRKMLRAICQFEPGRRFTLDGLKAFGLFFLCFSRSNCRFGLSNQIMIGMKDDRELAEFARELHIFQDFRNRAAHEGFHPQASNDLKGIWSTTAKIVDFAFSIRGFMDRQNSFSQQKRAS